MTEPTIRVLAHRYDPIVEPGKIPSILLRNRWQTEEEQSEQCKRKAKKVLLISKSPVAEAVVDRPHTNAHMRIGRMTDV